MQVRCASPLYTSYGSKLDMDFIFINGSRDQELSCIGYSLDAAGKPVQETSWIWGGTSVTPTVLSAPESRRLSNATPVTVVAECWIPDRGVKSCGQYACGSKYDMSKIIGIRVY